MSFKILIAVGLAMLSGQVLASERWVPVGAFHTAQVWKTLEPMSDDVREVRIHHLSAPAAAEAEAEAPAAQMDMQLSVMHEAPAQSSYTAHSNAPWESGRSSGRGTALRLAGTSCDTH